MQDNQYNLLTLFADGGFMMYPLLLCSLVALGVIIAKAYTLYTAHARSRELLERVETLGTERKFAEAVRVAEETPGPVAAILVSGLRRLIGMGAETREIENAIKTTGRIELGFLERGLTLLATLANVAPLLGFLGTVIGMIGAFGAIEQAGQVEASLVAGGIKVALITTAAGLVIAIPINIAYNWFVSRIDKLILDMEEGSGAVLRIIWGEYGAVPVPAGAPPVVPRTPVRSEPAPTLRETDPLDSGVEDVGGSDPQQL
ncbi:MAG TPA: MotA/TolQ/ExbB proton channel family protein [Longimicrobiales bacterium]|nr:MotA/TolQ/ExbB proton channel family protein [Longimicrobiales bacterium]